MVELPPATLDPFEAFTCYNSPYVAHDNASAIDLYPRSRLAPSPVAGEVVMIERVRAPWQPYARAYDYVVGIDTSRGSHPVTIDGEGAIARLLHLDPSIELGDSVDIGDELGTLLRAGFFAPWVANHLHLGFRPSTADLRRARGSDPLSLDVPVDPIAWDGTGTVDRAERTFIELEVDDPSIKSNTSWVGLGDDDGRIIDGGLPHYPNGGILNRLNDRMHDGYQRTIRLLGTPIGTATGPSVVWDDVLVQANGEAVTGLSLFCGRPGSFAIKLVKPGHSFEIDETVTVTIRSRETD